MTNDPWALGGALWAVVAGGSLLLGWGLAYALSGRRWLRLYRGDPATHAHVESAGWLVVISILARAGLALQLIGH
ncbi:MAG: hypothetical protein ABIP19_02785 [Dermatophilaceae bacterium]